MNTQTLSLAAAALIAAAPLTQAQAVLPEAVRCVDFLGFPDNWALPEKFKLATFKFNDRAGAWAPIVNVFTDLIGQPVHGMQFDERGLRINPPKPAATAELRVGAFAGVGIQIRAFDVAGTLQDSAFVPNDAIMHTVNLVGATSPITLIQLQGADNEGLLNGLCTTP
jgi:hypothetical protein